MTSQLLFQNTLIFRKPGVVIFARIIKVATVFIKAIFKNSKKKLKELEIMSQNAFNICIS